jgi:nuclease-like protein
LRRFCNAAWKSLAAHPDVSLLDHESGTLGPFSEGVMKAARSRAAPQHIGTRCDAVAVPDGASNDGPRRLRLRYPAVCVTCGIELSRGSEAFWDRAMKQATCLACAPDGKQPTAGTAGASAAAEGERRKEKRVEDVRRRYGDHAAAVAEEMAGRDAAATWGKGSEGESRVAAYVAREVGDAVISLHDRLIPGTRGNIDHIFVARTGVWVVDPKAYEGKVEKRESGPIWRRENEVYIGGRNRSALAKGVEKQVAAVIAALRADPTLKGTDVHAALCFLDSEWGLLDFPFQIGNVWVLYPGALRKRLKKTGTLSREAMGRIARRLDLSLPPAAGA